MYAGSTTFCIHVPMFDKNEPHHMYLKSRAASADLALPGRCGLPSSISKFGLLSVI